MRRATFAIAALPIFYACGGTPAAPSRPTPIPTVATTATPATTAAVAPAPATSTLPAAPCIGFYWTPAGRLLVESPDAIALVDPAKGSIGTLAKHGLSLRGAHGGRYFLLSSYRSRRVMAVTETDRPGRPLTYESYDADTLSRAGGFEVAGNKLANDALADIAASADLADARYATVRCQARANGMPTCGLVLANVAVTGAPSTIELDATATATLANLGGFVSLSADGRYAIVRSHPSLRVYRVADRRLVVSRESGQLMRPLEPGSEDLELVHVSGDELLLASRGIVERIDLTTGKVRWRQRLPMSIDAKWGASLVWAHQGTQVAVIWGDRKKLLIADEASSSPPRSVDLAPVLGPVREAEIVTCSGNDCYLSFDLAHPGVLSARTQSASFQVDVNTGKIGATAPDVVVQAASGRVEWFAEACRFVEPNGGAVTPLSKGFCERKRAPTFSPDGNWLAVADDRLRVFSLQTRREIP
ncbi:MAG: hypothetical protein HOO96_08525 [Polyangiaceae bacterium]|nr:hypothetical protein [Polyangiaceae bacterium]